MSNSNSFSGIIASGGKLFLVQIFVSCIAIFNTGYLARAVPKEVLALIPVAFSLGLLIQLLSNLGLPTACVRLIPELVAKGEDQKASALMRTTLLFVSLITVLAVGLVAFQAGWLARFFLKSVQGKGSILQMLPFLFFLSLAQTLALMMQAFSDFHRLSIVLLVSNMAQQICILPAYFLGGMTGILLLALPLSPVLQIVMFLSALAKQIFRQRQLYAPASLFRFSLPFYGYGYVRYLSLEADQILVAVLFSPAQLAVYYVARRFSQVLFMLLSAFYLPLMPRIGECKVKGRQVLNQLFTATTRYMGFIAIPVCLGMAAMSQMIVTLVAGKAYSEAGWVLTVKAIAMVAYAVYGLYGQNVFYLAKPSWTLWVEATCGLVAVASGILLGLKFGIVGFALGSLPGYLGAIMLAHIILRRFIDPRMDWPAIRWITGVVSVLLVVLALPQVLGWNEKLTWLVAGLGTLVFLLYFTARLKEDDFQVMSELAPARWRHLIAKGAGTLRAVFQLKNA